MHTPSGASAQSGADAATAVSAWHIVTVQGSDRGRENMEATLRAAEASVRSWCERHGLDVRRGVDAMADEPLPA